VSIFKYCDLAEIKIEHSFYVLEIDKKFQDTNEALSFLNRTNDNLRYLFRNEDISFLIGISETDGKTAMKHNIKNNGKGRHKTIIHGEKNRRIFMEFCTVQNVVHVHYKQRA